MEVGKALPGAPPGAGALTTPSGGSGRRAERSCAHPAERGAAPQGAPVSLRRPLGAGQCAFPGGWHLGYGQVSAQGTGESGRPGAPNPGRGGAGEELSSEPFLSFERQQRGGVGLEVLGAWKKKFEGTDQSALWRPKTVEIRRGLLI